MGISLLISETTGVSLAILIVGINLPFLILGFSQIGKQFALKSIIAIIGLALIVHFIPYPLITSDKLLDCRFWRFLLRGRDRNGHSWRCRHRWNGGTGNLFK